MINSTPIVKALGAYALADPLPEGLPPIAQNESAFPPSPAALAAGQTALASAPLYPDPDWSDLRRVIADEHGVAPQSILIGAGSMELIAATFRAYLTPGASVVAGQYAYAYAATCAAQCGARWAAVEEPGFTVSVNALLAGVTSDTRIVFLCNPGNPTGTAIPAAEVLRLRSNLPDDVLLVVDQAYGEFADAQRGAIFALADRGDTVILRTFSKSYGLAGARVGWGVFPPDIAAQVRKLLTGSNVSGISLAMAQAAMADQGYMRDVVDRTAARRDALAARLRALGLEVPTSATNFVLAVFGDADTASAANVALRDAGLWLRPMGGYGLPNALRMTVHEDATHDRLIETLQQVLT